MLRGKAAVLSGPFKPRYPWNSFFKASTGDRGSFFLQLTPVVGDKTSVELLG